MLILTLFRGAFFSEFAEFSICMDKFTPILEIWTLFIVVVVKACPSFGSIMHFCMLHQSPLEKELHFAHFTLMCFLSLMNIYNMFFQFIMVRSFHSTIFTLVYSWMVIIHMGLEIIHTTELFVTILTFTGISRTYPH